MKIVQKPSFYKVYKKLKPNQLADVDQAIRDIMNNPFIGVQKKGDLLGLYIYKTKIVKQEMLIAYYYDGDTMVLTLLGLGSHENFYRDLKRGD